VIASVLRNGTWSVEDFKSLDYLDGEDDIEWMTRLSLHEHLYPMDGREGNTSTHLMLSVYVGNDLVRVPDEHFHSIFRVTDDVCCDSGLLFVAETAHDSMALMERLLGIVAKANEIESISSFLKTVERAFHAWHGHDSDDPCRECDPVECERIEVRRKDMARRRAELAAAKEQKKG